MNLENIMDTNGKIAKLRAEMKARDLDAYVIPSTDPHISEYVPEHWSSRVYMSGFNGSAGTFVVTMSKSGLWTDGRYFLQAESQLSGSEVELHRLGNAGVLDFPDWLCQNLSKGNTVGFDGSVFQTSLAESLKGKLFDYEIKINSHFDLIKEVWKDRPGLPKNTIFEQLTKFSGESASSKIERIRIELKNNNADTIILSALDDICWTFNIRGNDVKFNPVCLAYSIITLNKVVLYIYPEKVPSQVKDNLSSIGLEFKNYDDFIKDVSAIVKSKIFYDKQRTNFKIYENIDKNSNKLIFGLSVPTKFKSQKNPIEIANIKNAMTRDGVAIANFQYWFENAFAKGEELDELKVMSKLRSYRAEQDMFFGESFNTIAGFASNGAIIHYGASEETNKKIDDSALFLLDSGGQYLDGTTDITRVFHLGTPTKAEKTDYTNVLKGMIDLNMSVFPRGTRGSQLDVLARKALWDRFENYKHGTGHGVGCFLNVHEGPQNIRTEENSTQLEIGMICSDEPGLYRPGKWGIRIENLVAVAEAGSSEFDEFYRFDNLTLYHIELKLVEKELLTEKQVKWLNDYNKEVFTKISPFLSIEIKKWLEEKTKAI